MTKIVKNMQRTLKYLDCCFISSVRETSPFQLEECSSTLIGGSEYKGLLDCKTEAATPSATFRSSCLMCSSSEPFREKQRQINR